MNKTPFAGLTALDPDDTLYADGGSFLKRNPELTDYFVHIGCITHRHDAHPAMPNPTAAPSAVAVTGSGSIPADATVYLTYTLLDNRGGETIPAGVVNVSTIASLPAPSEPIEAVIDYAAGELLAGDYSYAITLLDGAGGETEISYSTDVTRDPGSVNAEVTLSGLSAEFALDGASAWRLWRADNGSDFALIATGTDDVFVDTGFNCSDVNASPPQNGSTTNGANAVVLTMPTTVQEPALGGATCIGFAVYATETGDFSSPSLFGLYPVASAGSGVLVNTLSGLYDAAPPDVSTAIGGANKIDPDQELVEWHWKRPVVNFAALPTGSGTASGDVRVTLDDGAFNRFISGSWLTFNPVGTAVVDEADTVYPTRGKIKFVGASVADDAADGETVVTIASGGGGGSGGFPMASAFQPRSGPYSITGALVDTGAGTDFATAAITPVASGVANMIYLSTWFSVNASGAVDITASVRITFPDASTIDLPAAVATYVLQNVYDTFSMMFSFLLPAGCTYQAVLTKYGGTPSFDAYITTPLEQPLR